MKVLLEFTVDEADNVDINNMNSTLAAASMRSWVAR